MGKVPWIGPWIAAHPLISSLVILAPIIVVLMLRGPRRDGVRSALLVAALGVAFAVWQAPAPRFFYAYVIIGPAIWAAYWLASHVHGAALGKATRAEHASGRPAAVAFVAYAAIVATSYAIASQKLNVRTSVTAPSRLFVLDPSDLLIPAAPELPRRLYRWRVNDLEVLTPVPRPVADTLSYRSVVDGDTGLEKCSTAPLPCTPYLPPRDLALREPSRGLDGGFVRDSGRDELSTISRRCLGELVAPFAAAPRGVPYRAAGDNIVRCTAAGSSDGHNGAAPLVR